MGNKPLLNKLIVISSLAVLLPFSFDSVKKENINITPARLPVTDMSLTPLSNEEIMSLEEKTSGYYLMTMLQEDHFSLLTFNQEESFVMKEISYGEGYTIDIDDFFVSAVTGMLEITILQDPYTGDTQEENPTLYMQIASMEYCKYFYFHTYAEEVYLDFSDTSNQFYYSAGDIGLNINSYAQNDATTGGDIVDKYFYYDVENETFTMSEDTASEIFLYRLPSSFVESYCWQNLFNAIDDNSDAESLLAMWQGLTYYDKSYLLRAFYNNDPEDGSHYIDYGSNGKEKDMADLNVKFNQYIAITSQVTEKPLACSDVDASSIEVDYSTNIISGFNQIDPIVFTGDDFEYTLDYDGRSSFVIDDPDFYLLGRENVSITYCIDGDEATTSNNPLLISFKDVNANISPLEEDIPFATSTVAISDGEEMKVEQLFATSFTLESVPEGYEVALLTETSYRANLLTTLINDEEYYYFDARSCQYSAENLTFTEAYDDNWNLISLQEDTTYYLIYRLKETESSAPSYLCGHIEITTSNSELSFSKETQIDNYETFTSFSSIERFQETLALDGDNSGYFQSCFDDIYSQITSLSEQELQAYLEARSLYDRYYYEADRIILLNYRDTLLTTRSIALLDNALEQYIDTFAESPFAYEDIDTYVDNILENIANEIDIFAIQEEAAKEIADYLNEIINQQFNNNDVPEEAWTLLSNYVQQIYQTTDAEEIASLVASFKSEIDNIFNKTSGENNNG